MPGLTARTRVSLAADPEQLDVVLDALEAARTGERPLEAGRRRRSPRATESATSTVPGRATPVTRLATLTGLPNQSPARLTAMPEATPARSRGKSSSVSTTSTSFSTVSSSGTGSGQTNITASPIVLMNRTGGDGQVAGQVGQPVGQMPQFLGRHHFAEPGEADEVGEGDGDQARTRQRLAGGPLAGVDRFGLHHVPQLHEQHVLDHRAEQRGDLR